MISLFEWGLGEGVVRRSQTSDPQRFHQLSLWPPPPPQCNPITCQPRSLGCDNCELTGASQRAGSSNKQLLWLWNKNSDNIQANYICTIKMIRVIYLFVGFIFFICPQSKLIIKWTSAILSSRESHIKVRIWRNICKLWNSPMIYKFFHRRLLNRSRALFDPKYPIKSVNIRTQ